MDGSNFRRKMVAGSEASDSVYREAVAKLKILLSASEAVDRVSVWLYKVLDPVSDPQHLAGSGSSSTGRTRISIIWPDPEKAAFVRRSGKFILFRIV